MRLLLPGLLLCSTLCFTPPVDAASGPPPRFENSMWQWVDASDITDAELKRVAPHFPKPNLDAPPAAEMARYEEALEWWTQIYPHEYEALLNAPALTALNPWYEGYVQVYRLPRFLNLPITETRPTPAPPDADLHTRIQEELRRQKWIWVFEPSRYVSTWGAEPRFPDGFDVAAWRLAEQARARGDDPSPPPPR